MLALKVLLGDENSLYVTVCQRVLVDCFLALPITPENIFCTYHGREPRGSSCGLALESACDECQQLDF